MDPLRTLLDLVYPPACRICSTPPDPDPDFCPRCLRELPVPSRRDVPAHLDQVVSAYAYQGPVRDLIHRFKFRNERSLGRPLGRWIGEAIHRAGIRPHLVIPVPLHWRRAMLRGYDQAEILAREAARHMGVPMSGRIIRRVRATRPQTQMVGPTHRHNNVKGAFQLRRAPGFWGTVAIVDDVLTTGATASQCALLLRQAGARRVIAAVIARGSGPGAGSGVE